MIMKNLRFIALAIIVSVCAFSLTNAAILGYKLGTTLQSSGNVSMGPLTWYHEHKTYEEGGVTFEYPNEFFGSTPTVNVSVEVTRALAPGETFEAVIIQNSASSTTVFATVSDAYGVREASDDVIIHLSSYSTQGDLNI